MEQLFGGRNISKACPSQCQQNYNDFVGDIEKGIVSQNEEAFLLHSTVEQIALGFIFL